MNDLLRLVKRNPAIAIGVAAFVGLAAGAGWLPIPSLSIGSLVPAKAAPAAAPAPPPDPLTY